MFEDILKRTDVSNLLKTIAQNSRYNDKKKLNSINYSKFVGFEQSLFTTIDALYKFYIIVQDVYLLDDYISQLSLLIKKVDNFYDISSGINKLITKFTVLKLGYKGKELENRNEILTYIYSKYIQEGYVFHAINDIYVEDISNNGFTPQQYKNLYSQFIEVKEIVGEDILGTDFSNQDVSFTDSFLLAYYYAVNSPYYFYNLLCNNDLITKENDKQAYMKCDYDNCIKNLNKIIYKLDLSEKKAHKIRDAFEKEWSLIKRSKYCPTVMAVKRSLFLMDDFNKYLNTINNDNIDLYESVSKILDSKFDNIKCNFKISASDIEFISLPSYNDLVHSEKDISINNMDVEESSFHDEYGKVSILLLLGAAFIALGSIITMIMVMMGG